MSWSEGRALVELVTRSTAKAASVTATNSASTATPRRRPQRRKRLRLTTTATTNDTMVPNAEHPLTCDSVEATERSACLNCAVGCLPNASEASECEGGETSDG